VFATLLMVGAHVVLLAVLGVAVLAPLRSEARRRLLPAAPVFGAVLIAVVTNWTSRWLSVTQSWPIFVLIAVVLVVIGVRTGRFSPRFRNWRSVLGSRGPVRIGVLALASTVAGFVLVAAPSAHVGGVSDTNAVAPAYIIDQFYFAGVSSYVVDHPLLPGPTMTDSWVGNDPPATAPAADTVRNRLRFGQSATAAALSIAVNHSPYETVTSISLLWFLLLGLSAFVTGSLIGLKRRAALVGAALLTSSFFVVSQPLESKNDGLLGASLCLLAVGLSYQLLKDSRYSWPLVFVAAGVAATYSEYFTLLVPAIVGLALVGSRAGVLHRLNLLGGRWAASALLVPWAWVWLAQSFKITTRLTNGPTPFVNRSGWELFRAYVGFGTVPGGTTVAVLLTALAVVVLGTLVVGWVAVIRWHSTRGALVGVLIAFGFLQLYAISGSSGNLQYRVMQLGVPLLLLFAVLGWQLVLERAPAREPRRQVLSKAVSLTGAAFVVVNLATIGLTTSYARAETQHVPAAFTKAANELVDRVGADDVTVVSPVLPDIAALSLALGDHPEVDYPSIPSSIVYIGTAPHWSRQPDQYYVIGPGVTVLGEATYLERDGAYSIVTLGPTGVIVSPFTSGWARTTWMRGFTCGRPGVQVVVFRGGSGTQDLQVAAKSRGGSSTGIEVYREDGRELRPRADSSRIGGWTTETVRLPQAPNAILTLRPSETFAATGTISFPVRFGDGTATSLRLDDVDDTLADFCLSGGDNGTDGYDRELTFMRSAS